VSRIVTDKSETERTTRNAMTASSMCSRIHLSRHMVPCLALGIPAGKYRSTSSRMWASVVRVITVGISTAASIKNSKTSENGAVPKVFQLMTVLRRRDQQREKSIVRIFQNAPALRAPRRQSC
jgi:hypothetical protein